MEQPLKRTGRAASNQVTQLLQGLGVTQQELARAFHCSQMKIHQICIGEVEDNLGLADTIQREFPPSYGHPAIKFLIKQNRRKYLKFREGLK